MQYRYLISHNRQLEEYIQFVQRSESKMERFLLFLQNNYDVTEVPRVVVLTDCQTATELISDLPLPAYTNEVRTIFCPELTIWRDIYLQQLADGEPNEICQYYKNQLTENSVLQILGHEFVHHSNLFLDEAYEESIWFEEGMCEYISRKFFLTSEEFQLEKNTNATLVAFYEKSNAVPSLEKFGRETYKQRYADILYGYWKSFLAVDTLVEAHDEDISAVFQEYHRWNAEGKGKTLVQWFDLES